MTKRFLDSHPNIQKTYRFVKSGIDLYQNNNSDATAAQLAYSLTLSLFPLLICLNAMLSGLNITSRDILEWGRGIIPNATLKLFGEYTDYISSQFSLAMLIGAIILMLSAGASAFRCAVEITRAILGIKHPSGIFQYLLGFVFAIGFLVAVYIAVLVIIIGGAIPYLRYPLMFITLLTMVWGVYRIAAPHKRHVIGALTAAVSLAATGAVFSLTIEASARYSLVYGSISALVLLMLWLYFCGNIIIFGAIINAKVN